jgi:phosphatidylinositol alpha 1,6-mannosyltransferase
MNYPRAAFLPDTFHEVNGVAHTSRHLEAFALRRQISFLSIHCGPVFEITSHGEVITMQLKRGPASFGLDAHLDCDPFLFRYAGRVIAEVKKFGAELIHITGPGDMGILGYYVARRLGIPLVISWHTSLHEYAARRLERVLGFMGPRLSGKLGAAAEKLALRVLACFYRQAAIAFAPNRELVRYVNHLTGKPVFLMKRGVDTRLFSPARRNRLEGVFRLGYVGRLTTEKNVRFLAELGNSLKVLGRENFQIIVVGEGREESWLRRNVPNVIFTGVLQGDRLAEVYANMDLFVFPSRTDTFGNVILEAFASAVPAVVTDAGGPKYLVESGSTGFVAASNWDFISAVNQIISNAGLHHRMREAALRYARGQSWDAVFEQLFHSYENCRSVYSTASRPLLRNI